MVFQIMFNLLLVNNIHENTSQKVKTDEILEGVHAICNLHSCYNFAPLLQLCTCVTALHLCYMGMHMLSSNQKCAIL